MNNDDFESLISDDDLAVASSETSSSDSYTTQLPQQDLSFFGRIPVHVTLEVASTEISLKELMDVDASSVIVLDKLAGEPLDVKVNGALFAKAEVVVMNGSYGLRIVELCGNGISDIKP